MTALSLLTYSSRRDTVAVALNLVPFAGIAFLDRIGQLEDRFFASVSVAAVLLLSTDILRTGLRRSTGALTPSGAPA
jgi:hypothetical protein